MLANVKTVVLKVGRAPHWWDFGKSLVGRGGRDITKQFCWECKMKRRLFTIKLVGSCKAVSLVYPQFKHVSCALCYQHGKLRCKTVVPKLHEILYSVIKRINSNKGNAKAERLLQRFCEANHAYHRQ